MAPSRVWLINGASNVFGRELAVIAAENGDRVIATSRCFSKIESLKEKGISVVQLVQNQPPDKAKDEMEKMLAIHGRIDVVVNTADDMELDTLITGPTEAFQPDVFSPMNLFRAILPHFRARKSGILITMRLRSCWSVIIGNRLQSVTTAAIRSQSSNLAKELELSGVKVIVVERGEFRGDFPDPSSGEKAPVSAGGHDDAYPCYHALNDDMRRKFATYYGTQMEDHVEAMKLVYSIVTSGASGVKPQPLLSYLGENAFRVIVYGAQEAL